ncbi:hypothetical protein [Oryzobacter telluris]|uniref:hypothetical protein n=1 Tax=Oryzobacter telluris TaxID=3149179 RepID=UPI00370D9A91
MLPWWGWVLLWVVLLVASGLWLFVLARRVWGKTKALTRELSRASALVAELETRVDELRDADPPPTAVTQAPSRLREEYRAQRAEQAAVRRSRRAERMPRWARVD